VVTRAEELHSAKSYKELFEVLGSGVQQYPSDIELTWRYARAHYDMSELAADKDAKKEFLTHGLVLANAALAMNENHFAPHKWVAILTSALGDYVSTKEKIGNAYVIRDQAKRSLELKPGDATTLHLMGRWCHSIASIGWLERTAASALFATPPTSTYEEALQYFHQAQEADPQFIRNAIWIGDTHLVLKQKDKAKEWYEKAATLPFSGEIEKAFHDEANAKLTKL